MRKAEEARNAKRARNQIGRENGTNPSIVGPILAEHGGVKNDIVSKNSTTKSMEGIEMDENEIHIDSLEKNTMQNLENHAVLVINYSPLDFHRSIFVFPYLALNLLKLHAHSYFFNYIFKYNTRTMRVYAWNCQGFANKKTRYHLKYMIYRYDPDIIFISEAKIGEIKMKKLIRQYDFPNLRDDLSKPEWLLTCLYGFPYPQYKEMQWQYIKYLSHTINHPWVVMGDLNLVFSNEERLHVHSSISTAATTFNNSSVIASSSRDSSFVNFIYEAGLEDMGYSGRSFTWSSNVHDTGIRRSRLDRAIVNNDWFINFPDSELLHVPQLGSDHCPMLLDTSSLNADKKRNWKYFQCYEKDETLKEEIVAAWTHEVNELEVLQQQPPNQSSHQQVIQVENQIEHWHQIQSDFWGQKARDELYFEMDRNTKYHHAKENKRRVRNNIVALKDGSGNWCTTRDSLEKLLIDHYSSLHTTSSPTRNDNIKQCIPTVITSAGNVDLMKPLDVAEIHKALKAMKPWKAPGPDGFPLGFFQHHWDIVGADVVDMVKKFFHTGYILKSLNATNVSLIPKTKNKQFPGDLRTISLCNTSYKIISKILSTRLKKVMRRIISPLQDAYVQGKQISDNIHLEQEIIHTMKDKKELSKHLSLKLDMSKAFDRLEWSFIKDVMMKMGFCT
ncbi:uncharacterized protein LOC113291694 [Papaver somniferum]|uniref:uncharacterized protein LOC113291694 n=1 Tax=Papaver somniferum TaxID=3469 RepID=UPI000E6F87D0|nr:uncharacterized protein LOC113291694 [Papaver somniferum]